MPFSEYITPAISIVALVISCVSLVRTRKTNAKFLELEKVHAELSQMQIDQIRVQEIEEQQTMIDVEIYDGNVHITNIGSSTAFNVSIDFQNESDDCLARGEKGKLPFSKLSPNKDIKLIGSYDTMDAPEVLTIYVNWTNSDGTVTSIEETLQNS